MPDRMRDPELEQIEALHRDGLLTDAEYRERRRRIRSTTRRRIARRWKITATVIVCALILGIVGMIVGMVGRGNDSNEYRTEILAIMDRIAQAGFEPVQAYLVFSQCAFSEECPSEKLIRSGDSLAETIRPYLIHLDLEIQTLIKMQPPSGWGEFHTLYLRETRLRRDGFAFVHQGWMAQDFDQMAEGEAMIAQANNARSDLTNAVPGADNTEPVISYQKVLANISAVGNLSSDWLEYDSCTSVDDCESAKESLRRSLALHISTLDRASTDLAEMESSERIQSIHDLFSRVLELERAGWMLHLQGIEDGDDSLIYAGDEMLAEASSLRAAIVSELQALDR